MRKTLSKSIFMEVFGASPSVRVLDYLLSIRTLDCSISDIAENAGVSRTTLHYSIIPDLLKNDVLVVARKLGKIGMYKLNSANPLVKRLLEIDKEMVLSELGKRMPRKVAARLNPA